MTEEEMKTEVERLRTNLIIISKCAAYGLPGSRLRRKRSEAELKYTTLLREYERLKKIGRE